MQRLNFGHKGYLGGIYELTDDLMIIFAQREAVLIWISTIMPNYHIESRPLPNEQDFTRKFSPNDPKYWWAWLN